MGQEEVESGEFPSAILHPDEHCLALIMPKEQHQFKPMNIAGCESHKSGAVNS